MKADYGNNLAALLTGVADFLHDMGTARSSSSFDSVVAGIDRESVALASPAKPLQSSATERSKSQFRDLEEVHGELVRRLGGKLLRLSPNLDMIAMGFTESGIQRFHIEVTPDIPVFWFAEPKQTRKLVREAIRDDNALLAGLASALASLAEQVVDDLTGRVPLDLSGEEVRQLAKEGDEIAGVFYLLHNQRFGIFFNSLALAQRVDAVEPFLRWLAHAWDRGYGVELDPLIILESCTFIEVGLKAFRNWSSQRPDAIGPPTKLYRRALWAGPQRLMPLYAATVQSRSSADFSL